MKRHLIIILIIVILTALGWWAANRSNVYENTEVGIRFEYPDGYKLEERGSSIILLDEDFVPVEGGEGPPVISVEIRDGFDPELLSEWVRMSIDGLYPADVAIFRHGSRTPMFLGQYLDPEDAIRKDFQKVLNTLELY